MKKNNKSIKDKFYILNQPKNNILTVLVVGNTFPVSKNVHEGLDHLSKFSDIMFIFDDNTFKNIRVISKNKFATLYKSSTWVDSKSGYLKTLIRALKYEKDIFKNRHGEVVIANLEDLEIDNNIETKLTALLTTNISQPILKIERKSSADFYEIYSDKSEKSSAGLIKKIKNLIDIEEADNDTNRFSTHISTSNLMVFKSTVMDAMIRFIETEEGQMYIESFDTLDCREFFASLINHLGINNLNDDISDVKI